MDEEHIADVLSQLKAGTWRLPEAQEFSKDFLRRILPGRQRHSWRSPDAEGMKAKADGSYGEGGQSAAPTRERRKRAWD